MEDSIREFQQLFRQIQFKFSRFFGTMLSSRNITIAQYNVLSRLYNEGPLQMNQLADRLGITRPAVTSVVDRLVKENYVERVPHEKDRRVTRIKIMKRGKTIVEKTQIKMLNFLTENVSSFSKSEQDVIKRFYVNILKSIDALQ